jgi:hypothetical protein
MAETLDTYRSRYEDEWAREATINQRAVNASGLATLLGSGLYFIFLEHPENVPLSWVAWKAALASLIIAALLVAASMLRVHVASVAFADEWRKYERELEQVASAAKLPADRARLKFEAYMCDKYAAAATTNARANERRARSLFWAHAFVLATFVLSATSLLTIAHGLRDPVSDITKVEITNFQSASHDVTSRKHFTGKRCCGCDTCRHQADSICRADRSDSNPNRNRPSGSDRATRKPKLDDGDGGEGPCEGRN